MRRSFVLKEILPCIYMLLKSRGLPFYVRSTRLASLFRMSILPRYIYRKVCQVQLLREILLGALLAPFWSRILHGHIGYK